MSRSFRKNAWGWVSKPWTRLLQKGFRLRVKQACHIAEQADFDFDPDRDWEEAYLENKKLGEWGTRCGWNVPPDPDKEATWYGCYIDLLRKK